MFYSETLLSKTGPLARVWLSANLERKLSKTDIQKSNIEDSVNAIVDRTDAPMALRLSGQLLLGVVRIYSRKARYLLEDCNEAILKIKMAFKPGNVDLPTNQTSTANSASLTLPDVLTEFDLLAPVPEPSLLLGPLDVPSGGLNLATPDLASSQRLSSSIERGRRASVEPSQLEDIGDLGLDIGEDTTVTERDIEIGRRAPRANSMIDDFNEPSKLDFDGDLDLGLDIGEDIQPLRPGMDTSVMDESTHLLQEDINMGGIGDDFTLNLAGQDDINAPPLADDEEREASPLSQIGSDAERELEKTVNLGSRLSTFEPEEESVHHAQRAKKRKTIQSDSVTELRSHEIRQWQEDRSKILKAPSFLPKDPTLLALMEMQKNGGFVSSILGNGRSKGWAPELRGIISMEFIKRPSHLKRKRDGLLSGAQDRSPAGSQEPGDRDLTPRPDPNDDTIPQITFDDVDGQDGRDQSRLDSEPREDFGLENNFDETTMPLVHPQDSGPVSVGTKHAVHLLRDRFGNEAADSPAKRQKSSVLFQDLLPEKNTTRVDATKMFFEVLVLATKDAIKVEQSTNELGGPLRLRGKRGLWGAWAEVDAGGEIAAQEEEEEAQVAA